MITYEVDVFIGRNKPAKAAVVKCHDTGINLLVHLKTEEQVSEWRTETHAYKIPDGATAVLKIEKPDKKYVLQDGTCKGSSVFVELPPQSFTAAGSASAEINLFGKDGRRLTTDTFYIEVPQEVADGCTEDSENYVSILAEQIVAAVTAAESAKKSATEAKNAADNVAGFSNSAKNEAAVAVQSAENARKSASEAAQSANSAQNSVSEATTAADNAKNAESEAKKSAESAAGFASNAHNAAENAAQSKASAEKYASEATKAAENIKNTVETALQEAKAEIVQEVLAEIPDGDEVAY